MGILNRIDFVRDEIRDIPGIENKPAGGIESFSSKIGSALALGLKEKEIFVFGLLQWTAIGIAYVLWVQMLDWISEHVWRQTAENEDENGASVAAGVVFLWSLACVCLASFPVGILSGCMGTTHLLHRQGRESTVATCLKLALPRSWPLWAFHWLDGWITINQIASRLPKKNDKTTLSERSRSEALYYAWKLGVSGVLRSIVTGNSLGEPSDPRRFENSRKTGNTTKRLS